MRAELSRGGMRRALGRILIAHLTVARVAARLGMSWHRVNTAIIAEGKRVLIDDAGR